MKRVCISCMILTMAQMDSKPEACTHHSFPLHNEWNKGNLDRQNWFWKLLLIKFLPAPEPFRRKMLLGWVWGFCSNSFAAGSFDNPERGEDLLKQMRLGAKYYLWAPSGILPKRVSNFKFWNLTHCDPKLSLPASPLAPYHLVFVFCRTATHSPFRDGGGPAAAEWRHVLTVSVVRQGEHRRRRQCRRRCPCHRLGRQGRCPRCTPWRAMPCISCRHRAPASTPPPLLPPGDVIVVAAAAALTVGRCYCIGRQGRRPRCMPWRAMPCISCRCRAQASPPPSPPSGDVIVVVAAADLTAGRRLCCCHAPSKNCIFVAVRLSYKDGTGWRPCPHRCLHRWWRCHYLSRCPASVYILRV